MIRRRFRRRPRAAVDVADLGEVERRVRGRGPWTRVEVRIMRDEVRYHRAADVLRLHGLELVDLDPPAAGPEAALIFAGRPEGDVIRDVEELGVSVLASRPLPRRIDSSDAT
jgi:hypothetical protein